MNRDTKQQTRFADILTNEDIEIIKQVKIPAEYHANDLVYITKMRDQLRDQLRLAGQQFSDRQSKDGGRHCVVLQLVAVLKFLEEVCPQIDDQQLVCPLVELLDSLGALEKGVVAPMLAPRRKLGGKEAGSGHNLIKAASVFTVDRLVATGMDRPTAQDAVAQSLVSKKVRPVRKGARFSTLITRRTIRGWEAEIGIKHPEVTRALRQLEHDYAYVCAGSGVEADGLPAMLAFADKLKLAILQDELSPAEAAKAVQRQHVRSLDATIALVAAPTKPPRV